MTGLLVGLLSCTSVPQALADAVYAFTLTGVQYAQHVPDPPQRFEAAGFIRLNDGGVRDGVAVDARYSASGGLQGSLDFAGGGVAALWFRVAAIVPGAAFSPVLAVTLADLKDYGFSDLWSWRLALQGAPGTTPQGEIAFSNGAHDMRFALDGSGSGGGFNTDAGGGCFLSGNCLFTGTWGPATEVPEPGAAALLLAALAGLAAMVRRRRRRG